MKATLKFDLNDFDDREAHKRCVKSLDLCLLLWDLDNELRSRTKHAPDDTSDVEIRTIDEIRYTLNQLMEKHNIDLEELIT